MAIVVIGDLIVDDYKIVDVNRVSPEAPCLIGLAHDQYVRLGGAANVAANIHHLDNSVCLVGQGRKDTFLPFTEKLGMDCRLYEGEHSTKIRFIDNKSHVQLFRYDVEKVIPPHYDEDLDSYSSFIDSINFKDYKVCVIVDYLKGMIRHIKDLDLCEINIVSTKSQWPNNLITSEQNKTNILIVNEKEYSEIKSVSGFNYIIRTEGSNGMSIFKRSPHCQQHNLLKHIDGIQVEVFDVTGAGDTVTAVVSFCLNHFGLTDDNLIKACECANKEAAKVVAKMGTTIIQTPLQEVIESFTRS